MNRSEKITNLLLAVCTVQDAVPSISKSSTNPHFKSKYAKLDAIWEEISTPIREAGLLWITTPNLEGLWYRLEWNGEGEQEFIEGVMPLVNDGNPQHLGSSLTYARRYALVTIFNLMLNEDDDGNEASKRSTESHFTQKCVKCGRTDTRIYTKDGVDYSVCPLHYPT